MLNIGIVCDTTWDNFILIDKKFKKICPEKFKIHAIYGKTLEIFNNCSNKYNIQLIRHYSDNLCNTILNMLKLCELWIIFSNNIEYLTPPSLVIQLCDEYNIKYCIIREYNRENDYYSFKIDVSLSFKKIINSISPKECQYDIKYFDYKEYNQNYSSKQVVPLCLSPTIKNKIKSSYGHAVESKNSIKLLYDKDEIKREKQVKKTIKEANQLQFLHNRLNYYR